MKARGWTFVGPTTVYAFMQAMGLVNNHVEGCPCRVGSGQDATQIATVGTSAPLRTCTSVLLLHHDVFPLFE